MPSGQIQGTSDANGAASNGVTGASRQASSINRPSPLVVDVLEHAGRRGPRSTTGIVGDPTLAMDDARELVLLRHVVELVLRQVRAVAGVVVGPTPARDREEPDLDAVHGAFPLSDVSFDC
jgi:hypothetical protein